MDHNGTTKSGEQELRVVFILRLRQFDSMVFSDRAIGGVYKNVISLTPKEL